VEYAIDETIERSFVDNTITNKKWRDELIKAAKDAYKIKSTEAADIGTIVHDYAYHYEKGDTFKCIELQKIVDAHKDSQKIINGLEKFIAWKKKNKDEILNTEEIVAYVCGLHQKAPNSVITGCLCYAGKYDRLARRGDLVILQDFKTSNGIYPDHFIQMAAYATALEYWTGLNVGGFEVLRFGKENGEFQTLLIDDYKEMQSFRQQAWRCRQTYEFKKIENDKRFKFGGMSCK